MPDEPPRRGSDPRALTDLDGSVEDTRSLFDQLFGDGDDVVETDAAAVIPVAEVLGDDDGPPTVATRTVEPALPSRGAPAAAAAPTTTTPRPTPTPTPVEPVAEVDEEAEAPVAAPPRRSRGRVRARKVKRIIRHIEPWSVLKVSLFFFLTTWLILLVAGLLIWSVAVNTGGVESVEDFIKQLMGYEEFKFLPDQIFRAYALGGLVVCVALSAFSVIATLIFNLISDLMGGLRVTVIEEERIRS